MTDAPVDLRTLDCPTICEQFDASEIMSTVRTFLASSIPQAAKADDALLFAHAYAKYVSLRMEAPEVHKRSGDDYSLWLADGTLPYYMGSWFIEARKQKEAHAA